MKAYRRYLSFIWVAIGVALCILSLFKVLDDFWLSFGIVVAAVGFLQIIKNYKYYSNQEYREQKDIEYNDERNKYISMKAWAWSGYIVVLALGVAVIGARILGQPQLSEFAACTICFIIVVYWISYYILRRKY